MNKMKKISCVLVIFFMILSINMIGLCAQMKTQLSIIEKASEIKYLQNDQGYITKSIVDVDSDKGEVTVELKLSNSKKKTEEEKIYDNTEIIVAVNENIVNKEEKLNTYMSYINTFAEKVFEKNSNTKIGIVGIKGTISDSQKTEDKITIGPNDENKVKGTEDNAEVVVNFSKDIEEIKNGLQNMNASKKVYYTNLQATLRLANNTYSNEVNKILILLYDNVPDIAIGVKAGIEYGGIFSEYATIEEAVTGKHEKIASNTRSEILSLKEKNVKFSLLRPADTSYDETWYNTKTGEKIFDFDGSPYVNKIYGTIENPTYGKMYSLDNDNLEKIVTEYIYNDVMDVIARDMNKIKIVDYFPDEIIENFDFSYVGNASKGNVSDKIDINTKTIEWDIDNLKGDEVATLKYKLKIKDMQNQKLLNKTIATNEKVILTYNDVDEKGYTITLESSPKIQLSEIKEADTTTATGTLPNTGAGIGIFATIAGLIIVAVLAKNKYNKLKNV